MSRYLYLLLLVLPLTSIAAVPMPTSTVPDNIYTVRSQITIHTPVLADIVVAGASVTIDAPVKGEVLAGGGTVSVTQGAGGGVRVAGGKVTVQGPVQGDVAVAGGTIHVFSDARSIYAAGGSVDVEGSSKGPVTIYGANVFLSGTYASNVTIIVSNRLTLGKDTHIAGILKYSAPETLVIPEGAVLTGGAQYTGAYAYVPTNRQAHRYALIGIIVFFAVRVVSGLIVAGLIAGLLPLFADRVSKVMLSQDPMTLASVFAIGTGITVLTPLLCLFLVISFVGAGLGIMVFVLYIFLELLAYAFSGIVLGALLRRTVLYRIHNVFELNWKDALLGTVCVHAIGLIPYVGTPAVILLTVCCAGALVRFAYQTMFTFKNAH